MTRLRFAASLFGRGAIGPTPRRTSLAALAACLALAVPAAAQDKTKAPDAKVPPAPVAVPGAEVLSVPGEARGDAAATIRDLLAVVAADPDAPGAILALEALGRSLEHVPASRGPVRALLEKLAAAPRTIKNGWAQERYAAQLASYRLADGDRRGLEALAASRGHVRSWLVVGPFGHATRSILDEVFQPEIDARAAGVDLKAKYATTKGDARWAKVPTRPLDEHTDWVRALRGTNGACYLLAHVSSDRDQDVVLDYGWSSAKVFVNRALVGVVDRHRRRLDQRVRIAAKLRKGWNRILVKTGEWTSILTLRIASPDGHAAPGLTYEDGAVSHDVGAAADVADANDAVKPSWLLETLEAAARGKDAKPEAIALLAFTVAQAGLGEEAYALLERPELAPLAKSAWFQVLRADVIEAADHLPEAARRVKAKASLEEAVKLDPFHAHARRRLAEIDLADEKLREGLAGLEAILAQLPDDHQTRLRLFEAFREKGWHREAEKTLVELETRNAGAQATVQAGARWVEAKGDPAVLARIHERILALDRRSHWVYERRQSLCLLRGDVAGAKKALEDELAASPSLEAGRAELARAALARSLGDRDAELELLEKALEARPEDLNLRDQLAQTLAERGRDADKKKALGLLDDLLEVEPARVNARHLRASLRGEVETFWREWEFDARDLAKGSPEPTKYPNAATVCLMDQTVTRIRRDGSATEAVHQAWKILTDEGVEAMGKRPPTGDTMAVRVLTSAKDEASKERGYGEVLEPIRAGGSFEMPGLAPGAIVEHSFLMEHGAREFQYTNGPWYLRDPNLQEPYVHSRWVVIAPKDMQLEAIEKNLEAAGCKKTVIERGDDVVRIWETRDQERIEPEPLMPPKEEFLPWVKLYERRSLEELQGLYADVALSRTYVTPSVADKAKELCSKLEGDTAKLKAIYAFVKEHVRTPEGGNTAAEILASRAGSSLTLMQALLDAAGVKNRLALAGLSPDVDRSTDWEHPEPWQFNRSLLRVEPRDGKPLWVFPEGAKYAPMDLLPAALWGSPVLILEGASGVLDVLPRGDPAANGVVTRIQVALGKGGTAKAHVVQEMRAAEAYRIKENVKNAQKSDIQTYAAQRANQLFTGASVKSWKSPSLEDPNVPFTFVLDLTAEKVVRPRGDGTLTVSSLIEPRNLKRTLGGRATRKFDLVLGGWTSLRDEVELDLGPYTASRLPGDVQQQSHFGQYSLTFRRAGDKILIERTLTLEPQRVTPAEYKSFLAFLDKVDSAERRPLVVDEKSDAPGKGETKPESGGKR